MNTRTSDHAELANSARFEVACVYVFIVRALQTRSKVEQNQATAAFDFGSSWVFLAI